jgi:hypothetical protein
LEVFMPANVRWAAPIAITASYWLRFELAHCEQHAGCDFEYSDSIPDGRKYAHRCPMMIIGSDLVARVRNPLYCGGLVVVATLDPNDQRTFLHAGRIRAAYVISLPQARLWLAEKLLSAVAT